MQEARDCTTLKKNNLKHFKTPALKIMNMTSLKGAEPPI